MTYNNFGIHAKIAAAGTKRILCDIAKRGHLQYEEPMHGHSLNRIFQPLLRENIRFLFTALRHRYITSRRLCIYVFANGARLRLP